MKLKLTLLFLFLLVKAFPQIGFYDHIVIDDTYATQGARFVYASDLDGDGDKDVLSASLTNNKIVWFRNTDGKGNFVPQQVITTDAEGANTVFSADLDGDGDPDVLSASDLDNKIAWYENLNGQADFGPQIIISDSATGASSVYAADLDGDGDMDVLSTSSGNKKLLWYENMNGQGDFGSPQEILSDADGASSVYADDIDGDGYIDVLLAMSGEDIWGYNGKIVWFKNMDGQGNFSSERLISLAANANCVTTADIDGDGDMDVLSASDDRYDNKYIAWHENTDGQGNFETHFLAADAPDAQSVYAVDIDGDGDMDILSASMGDNKIAWYKNEDGLGNFGTQQIITTNALMATSVFASDIDNDGDIDVLSSSWSDSKIAWYKNTDGEGNFILQQILDQSVENAVSVYSADIDGDGDQDVLSASMTDNKVAWFENTNGKGSFGLQRMISSDTDTPVSVFGADLDGDNDNDVLVAVKGGYEGVNSQIVWYKNLNGQGDFSDQNVITTDVLGAASVYAADIDGDGDKDVLSVSVYDNKLSWYENENGQGSFGPQKNIATGTYSHSSLYVCDIDGDGDMDVLSAISDQNRIVWYENTNSTGSFGPQRIISEDAENAVSVYAADLDGDGDMDVLSASRGDKKIAWYANEDGQGNFGSQQILTSDLFGARAVSAADFDNDGDMDVLYGSYDMSIIAWQENVDGLGNFGPEKIIDPDGGGVTSVFVSDIDRDGDPDVLASCIEDRITWYENVDISFIEQTSQEKFSVYPVPTTGVLNIQSINPVGQIKIYNKLGQLVAGNINKNTINISGLSQGVYFIEITDNEGNTAIKKVLKTEY